MKLKGKIFTYSGMINDYEKLNFGYPTLGLGILTDKLLKLTKVRHE